MTRHVELKGHLALIQAKSHFHRVPLKTREGSGLSSVTQLKSEAVHGAVIKILGAGVRQGHMLSLPLICCATLNKALHSLSLRPFIYKMDTIMVHGI